MRQFKCDVEFMLHMTLSWYWTFCWKFFVPSTLTFFFFYYIISFPKLEYSGEAYPPSAIYGGWILVGIAMVPVPLNIVYSMYKSDEPTMCRKITKLLSPSRNWHPQDPLRRSEWMKSCRQKNSVGEEEELLVK